MNSEFELCILSLLLLNMQLSVEVSICPDTYPDGETKPLYVLSLLPIPKVLSLLSGHRIAQDEINNRTDILPGYHIELIVDTIENCSSTEAGLGLTNLVKYTVNPPCRPVVAVAGLVCSSHTSALSPVAGHDGFDLIQLSSANSPIFETRKNRFPHLWRFSGSALVYSDAVLAIMAQYNWTRIGIVYNTKSVFYSEVAKDLKHKFTNSMKQITFLFGLSDTRKLYLDTAIYNIIDTDTSILLLLLDEHQTEAFLIETLKYGLVYPHFISIHIEKLQSYYESSELKHLVYKATHGHMYLFVQSELERNDTMLLSSETYATLEDKLKEDFELLKSEYNVSNLNFFAFSNTLYDQIWSLALALNKSLPILQSRNLSIDNYTIGQDVITAVIEEQMANLSFQGAGGWVEFNQYRGVSTPVEVYWILDDGKEELVGIYNPLNISSFIVHINASNLPNDTFYQTYKTILIPYSVTILLYILTGAITVFTTIQLIVYLYYREHKVIKATSPYLSLLMFVGCYLLSTVALLSITLYSFELSPQAFTVIICLVFVSCVNGVSLILITLFVKLLRIARIFSSKLRTDIGNYWGNLTLLAIVLTLSIFLNIILAPVLIFVTPAYDSYNVTDVVSDVVQVHIHPAAMGSLIGIGIMVAYMIIFLLINSCLAIHTRKIKYSDFKDTKKVNFLIALLIVIVIFSVAVHMILYKTQREMEASIAFIFCSLSITLLCQLILFTPKILPTVLEKYLKR